MFYNRHTALPSAILLVLILCSAGLALGADAPGIAVGKPAPPFMLQDQHGRVRSLDTLVKKGNVALVFFRSADW